MLDNNSIDIFALSVQYLSASKVSVELNVEKVECDMHQGVKVGSSAIREFPRSVYNVIVSEFLDGEELMSKLRDVVKNFEHDPANRK